MVVPYKGKSLGVFWFDKAWKEKVELANVSLAKVAKRIKKWADMKRRHREFEEEDLVMVSSDHSKLWENSQRIAPKVRETIFSREKDWEASLPCQAATLLRVPFDVPCKFSKALLSR